MMDDVLTGAIELAFGLCAVFGDGMLSVGIEHPDCLCRVVVTTNVRHRDTIAMIDGHEVQVRIHVDGKRAAIWIDDQRDPKIITPRSGVNECGPQS